MAEYDSLIFDMDGTLWDAGDSYAEVWNVTNRMTGIGRTVQRNELIQLMGKTIDVIFDTVMHGIDIDKERYLKLLDDNENDLMPLLGGTLYPGVRRGLIELVTRYPLYMASNCGTEGLRNMLAYTDLTELFSDTITHGETGCGKDRNISILMERHGLKRPLYIGDTRGDELAAHAAGADMAWARWGFGTALDPELTFESFAEMTDYLMKK